MICPVCNTSLELTLQSVRETTETPADPSPEYPPETNTHHFILKGRPYELSAGNVINTGRELRAWNAIQRHYIDLPNSNGVVRRFPIRQLFIETMKATHPSGFTPDGVTVSYAQRILHALGFRTRVLW